MSRHQEWKMIHLLYLYGRTIGKGKRRVLTAQELTMAGVHCDTDSRQPLEDAGIVKRRGDEYELSRSAREIVRAFTLGEGPKNREDIKVDYPEAFVVMAFSEPWSNEVFTKMFQPGIVGANFNDSRGDTIVRLGGLSTNVWQSICQAGVIVADVSVPNPNVYYEIGLADALGKPVFLFKQDGVTLPADFAGVHYYTYDLNNLAAGARKLTDELKNWADEEDNKYFGVKALVDR